VVISLPVFLALFRLPFVSSFSFLLGTLAFYSVSVFLAGLSFPLFFVASGVTPLMAKARTPESLLEESFLSVPRWDLHHRH